jgi:hypothetical protein
VRYFLIVFGFWFWFWFVVPNVMASKSGSANAAEADGQKVVHNGPVLLHRVREELRGPVVKERVS